MRYLPAVVPSDPPNSDRVDGLCVQCVETFWVDELQGTVIQIHKQIFALLVKYNFYSEFNQTAFT